jgi:hypothetical protein
MSTVQELREALFKLEERLRRLSQRERQTAGRNPLDSYERGYRIGLAVGISESAKKIRRATRPTTGRAVRSK